MAEFEIRAFQGKGDIYTVTLSGSGFTGLESLVAAVSQGDGQAALLTVFANWNTGVNQTTPKTLIDIPFTALQTASLLPGAYSLLLYLADNTAPLAKGLLTIYPTPGGSMPPFYRALASPAMAQVFLPELSQDQIDLLPTALIAATRAVETYCARPLFLDSYDHIIRPFSGTIRLRLRSRPVVEVSRVSVDVIAGALIYNSGAGGLSGATVKTTMTSPGSMQIQSLTFTTILNGVVTNQTIALSSYPTFGQLCSAINSLGNGWSASVQPPWSSYPTVDSFGTPGTRNALNEYIWVHTHSMPLGQWWVDGDNGFIEINEPIPGGFLIPNPRVERTDTRYWGIRVTYRAGYAYLASDIALGYYSVPEDLAIATSMTANAIIQNIGMGGPVVSQTVKDRSYTLREEPSVIPQAAQVILSRYMEWVF